MCAEDRLVAVVGPTATGKSELAARLALRFGGEVVSADSRQVYRHLDIGTAKPSGELRAQVPHHLIDVVDPDEEYSVALFLRQARSAITDIQSRSKLPVLAGGTGQYIWALLEGWQVPEVPPDAGLRLALEKRARTEGAAALFEELVRLDGEAARRVDPANTRRVVRALEILSRHGEPPAAPRKEPPPYTLTVVGLTLDRASLYRRIDERVDRMVATGWVGEVRSLIEAGYDLELPSLSSLGYGELARHIMGELSLDDAVSEIKRKTRRLARQQYTWFKHTDERIGWFEASPQGFAAAETEVGRLLETRE